MKTIIISLIFTVFIAVVPAINGQNWQKRVSIANGGEKVVPGFGIKIKFLDVTEDSRCPSGVTCIWAGNAKVRIQVFAGRRASTFEINSTLSPNTITIGGYEIKLESIDPRPNRDGTPAKESYSAVFAVRKLSK